MKKNEFELEDPNDWKKPAIFWVFFTKFISNFELPFSRYLFVFFLTWRLVIKLDILMVQINQYTTLNDQWRWNSKIKSRNWNLIRQSPNQFRTKLGLTFSAIWDFFKLFFDVFWDVCNFFWVGDFTSRDQTPHSNVDSP